MVGELDAGNPHVQFDEGVQETCDSATRLCPTLLGRDVEAAAVVRVNAALAA